MHYTKPIQLKDGRYYSKVLGDGDGRVTVQLKSINFETDFNNEDITIRITEADVKKIDNIDEQNMAAALDNSTEWFGKPVQKKTLETAYMRSHTSGCMNVSKINKITRVFSHDKKLIDDDSNITENTVCDMILEFSGILFMKKTFCPVWRIFQVRMKPPVKKPKEPEYLFQDDESESGSQKEEEDFL